MRLRLTVKTFEVNFLRNYFRRNMKGVNNEFSLTGRNRLLCLTLSNKFYFGQWKWSNDVSSPLLIPDNILERAPKSNPKLIFSFTFQNQHFYRDADVKRKWSEYVCYFSILASKVQGVTVTPSFLGHVTSAFWPQ